MTIPAVATVGDQIERAWRATDYDPRALPELCVRSLGDADLPSALTPDEILSWALRGDLPRQVDPTARFGQPPITLFRARRFYIAALFWVDGLTTIHDHGFSGAFQVLSGSSIETTFAFETTRNVGDHLRFGTLAVKETSLLRQGDVRPIVAGPASIHSLFHLPRPTVSLIVRSFADASPGIQLTYAAPGIATNTFFVDETLDRMIQIVELLRATDDPRFEARAGELIASLDLHGAFSIIKACRKLPDRTLLARLIDKVRDPEARRLFAEWAETDERLRLVQGRRSMVHDPDLRFYLAVLLNAQRRTDAAALVAAHTPGLPPPRQIASWTAKLSTITARLQLAGAAWEPNLLGLPTFTPRREECLAAALGGARPSETADEAAFLDQLRALPALRPLFR